MPRPYDGPKCQSRDKPAPTSVFLSVGDKTRLGVWAREQRDRAAQRKLSYVQLPLEFGKAQPVGFIFGEVLPDLDQSRGGGAGAVA